MVRVVEVCLWEGEEAFFVKKVEICFWEVSGGVVEKWGLE